MPTYDGMARELGVSKQTIRNWAARIDPQRAHIDTSGDTHVIDETLASMIAHKIAARANDQEHEREGERIRAREAMTAVVDVSDRQIEAVREHYEALMRVKDESNAALLAEKDERIRDLKSQLEEATRQLALERAEHESTRRDLAQAKELEGFHWPWQRREIRARYALPPAQTEPEA